MQFFAEFMGAFIFLLGGYSYMCNISLKKTLVGKLNYIELAVAWSLAVGFGLAVAVLMGGQAHLNPGVTFGKWITEGIETGAGISFTDGLLYILMQFCAAGAAEIVCLVFFWDSFKASPDAAKRGIFSAYPVEKNIPLNFFQEVIATFMFLFLVLFTITCPGTNAVIIGIVGFAAVMLLSLTLNSTGFSMNAMRSFFSSIWFAILPFPNKNGEKVDWKYQIIVNLLGSSLGGILAVLAVYGVVNAL